MLLGPAVPMGMCPGLGYRGLTLKQFYPGLTLTRPAVLARPADVPGQEEKTTGEVSVPQA